MNWYIVQAYSGFENKVAETIKEVMSKSSMGSNLGEILVPTHKITEVKQGKRIQKQKKYFPGYVLVKLDLNKEIYHKIKNIQKVSGFLGPEGKPVPVSENQIKKIVDGANSSKDNPSAGITFEIGEKVKACDGPFASFTGMVEEINDEKSRLKVSVSIFGRPTPVDLAFNEVEKT